MFTAVSTSLAYLPDTGAYIHKSNSWEFDFSRARKFQALDRKLYKKCFWHASSLLPGTNYNKWMAMPNQQEQKLSNPSAEEEFTQVLKAC